MMQTIPFAPLPVEQMKKISAPFVRFGAMVRAMFPSLETELSQAGIDIGVREYCSIMAFIFLFYSVIFSIVISLLLSKFMAAVSVIAGINIPHFVLLGIALGIVVGMLVFIQIYAYPKMQIKKRVRLIESNIVYALRTMLVQLKSGISLFDSLSSIAYSKRFGQLGIEMKATVDSINTGNSEEDALRELAEKNPSPYLRKVIWQIVNGMKAGADVSQVLEESVSSIVREQEIEIQGYGSSLRILSLIYLMIGIIIPALGLTFLIVIGSFPKIKIGEMTFWALLGFIVLAEFMFIGIMKSRRPNLMGD